ncbi:hypothetical protein [Sulfurimonas sp. HSL3-2]|uniref:hypothetical protein n=1 Tax=Hydrocurvibacter mobilis TaxID=3131936 RepID=UPI0031F75AD2
MTEETSLALVQTIINSEKDLIVVFKGGQPILSNSAFNAFFSVSSLKEYTRGFGEVIDSFVPHPSYFHKEKVAEDENWLDAIMKLEEIDRIVSMMTPNFEPCAFSVRVDSSVEDYQIAAFTDITRDLIKRIMTENNTDLDQESGAYDKKYFMQVYKTYEDAAVFNEKIIGVILATINEDDNPDFSHDEKALKDFVEHFKNNIRHDDMLVRWEENKFLLVYLVDNEKSAKQVLNKLLHLVKNGMIKSLECKLSSVVQKEKESIDSLIRRVQLEE